MMRVAPVEVVTDHAPVYPAVLEELLPAAWHRTDRYANNQIEADHGRLKSRLHPMRGLKQDRNARIVIAGHGFVQNLRRGHTSLRSRSRWPGAWRSRSTSLPWRCDPWADGSASACRVPTRCNRARTATNPGTPARDVTLSWKTFTDAADQAGWSRRYGGIHFYSGDMHGRVAGASIGWAVYNKAKSYWEG
jgi:DDE domain